MPRVRVVLANMPRLLHDIVHSMLTSELDIEIAESPVRELQGEFTAELTSERVRGADVVIVTEREFTQTTRYDALLIANPKLRVVAVSGDGRNADLYEMRPCRIALGELSAATLADAVRAPHAMKGAN